MKLIGKDWMLVSAAHSDGDVCGKDFNTMTASWGGVGVLWNRPVAFVFIRPERYTYSFTEGNEYMTLSFYDETMKDALKFCGRNSGRDFNKVAECSLTPVFEAFDSQRAVYFEEAELVLVVKKLYSDFLKEESLPRCAKPFYAEDGLHKQYICEIVRVLVKE